MKKIEKLNVTTKMLLVLLYSFLLLLIAVFVINLSDAREESKGYGTKARDEYLQVFSKVIEMRSEPTNDETNLKKESSQYSIYTQITQTTDKEVKNIELYVNVETEDGTKIFFEETKKQNTNYKGTPCTNSSYFKTSPSGFNRQNSYVSSSSSYKKSNTLPKIVYLDVYYDVVISDTQIAKRHLKYFYLPMNVENEDFTKYELSDTLENKVEKQIDTKELKDYLTINLKYTLADLTAETETKRADNFVISIAANEDKFAEQGKYVVNSRISLFAKGKNHPTDTENYFPDYILISENIGVLVDKGNDYLTESVKNSLTSTYRRSLDIPHTYEVDELYLYISVTLNTGETIQAKSKFAVQR